MQFQNAQAIVDFAIEKEKEAAAFYDMVSKQAAFSGVKEMFKEFAAEERKHQAMLEKMDSSAMGEYKFKWVTDLKRSDYVVDMEYKDGMGYNEILMLAMKREEKALALYNELQAQAKTEKTKKLFKILCQEESKHKLALETKYDDYMAEMGD